MKHIVLGMALVLFASCGSSSGVGQDPQPQCNSKVGLSLCPPNPSVLTLRTKSGNQNVSSSYVTGIQVQVFKSDSIEVDLERQFRGAAAIQVVQQLGFSLPGNVSTSESMWTGFVTLFYLDPSSGVGQTKEFNLFDGTILEDVDFQSVTYSPGSTVDKAWLARQPG